MKHLRLVYDADAPVAAAPAKGSAAVAPVRRHNLLTLSVAALAIASSYAVSTVFDPTAELFAKSTAFASEEGGLASVPNPFAGE
jgi:hypothetical protein